MKKILTLCVIHKDSSILLGMKKQGLGKGYWNGFGGKLNLGETIENAAKRELKEEIGITAFDIKKRGVLNFKLQDEPEILEVHVFSTSDFKGKPIETEEMRPQWFKINEIPYDKMWPDDKYWLPLLLNGKKFRGNFYFGENEKLLQYQIEEI